MRRPRGRARRGRQVYTAADFARYAPKNASDMLAAGAGLPDPRQRELARARPGDRQRAVQRPAPVDQVRRPAHAAVAHPGRQRRADRDRRRGHARYSRASRARSPTSSTSRRAGCRASSRWTGEARAHYRRSAVHPRRGLGQRPQRARSNTKSGSTTTRRGAARPAGLTLIRNGAGAITETRDDVWTSNYDAPKLSGKLTQTGAGGSVAHLNGHYQRTYNRYDETRRTGLARPARPRCARCATAATPGTTSSAATTSSAWAPAG